MEGSAGEAHKAPTPPTTTPPTSLPPSPPPSPVVCSLIDLEDHAVRAWRELVWRDALEELRWRNGRPPLAT